MVAPAMSDMKSHFAAFGINAANRLLANVSKMPQPQALSVLHGTLNQLSPKAFERAEAYTNEARDQGLEPRDALHAGVSRALSESLLDELHELGRKHASGEQLSGVNPILLQQRSAIGTTQTATSGRTNTNTVTGLQVGPFVVGGDPKTQLVQVMGKYVGPRWATDGNIPAGIMSALPVGPDKDGNDWQKIISDTLSHDCHPCVSSSMVDAGPTHRYGNLLEFIPGLPAQINKDFVGLLSGDGQGGDDANKDPDTPILLTTHPTTGDPWGFYMYLAVPFGGQPWGTVNNPVSLLFKWTKIGDDCGSFLTAKNVAEVAALTIASGGTYGLLAGLGLVGSCYIWQFVKVVVTTVVEVAEDVGSAVATIAGDIAGLACNLVSTPGLPQAVTAAGVQSKNPTATAVGVGAALANKLCGNQQCLPGQTLVNGVCACPVGFVLGNQNGVTMCIEQPWYSSPAALLGLGALAVIGLVLAGGSKKKTRQAAA